MSPIRAIDVHAHYGRYTNSSFELVNDFASGDANTVLQRARLAGTSLTIVSPLAAMIPRHHGDPVPANNDAAALVSRVKGLMHWVVIDPLKPETFEQADDMLKHPSCAGIKIHPEEHGYAILEHAGSIFEFAAARHAVVQTHSGEQNSLPADFLPSANRFPEVTLILSHLGCGWDGDITHQVRAIQLSRHGNIYTDTSSAKSLTPQLLEWAVREIGADRILYGTDSPLYFAPMLRARVDHADISERDKLMILRQNTIILFNITEETGNGEEQ